MGKRFAGTSTLPTLYEEKKNNISLAYQFTSAAVGSSHRRRRSSIVFSHAPQINVQPSDDTGNFPGASSGLPANSFIRPLSTIPGSPAVDMSLSRSPSPQRGGGWSSPGLTTPYDSMSGRSTPRRTYREFPFNVNGGPDHRDVTWASAKAKSEEVNGGVHKSATKNNSFLARSVRNVSGRLPSFFKVGNTYAEKEKMQRGRLHRGRIKSYCVHLGGLFWRLRLRLLLILTFIAAIIVFYVSREYT